VFSDEAALVNDGELVSSREAIRKSQSSPEPKSPKSLAGEIGLNLIEPSRFENSRLFDFAMSGRTPIVIMVEQPASVAEI